MLLAYSATCIFSQCDSVGTFDYAAIAGIGVAGVRVDDQQIIGKKGIVHFQVGALADYTVFKNFFLESGLSFQHKGYTQDHVGYVEWENNTYHLYYLQIPINANYKFHIEKVWLAPQLGPYMSIALGGSHIREGATMNEGALTEYKNVTKIFKDKDRFRRFDCGLRIGANVLFLDKYRIGMGYDLGFVNFRKEVMDKKVKSKNGAFSIQFAYYVKFKKKEKVESTETDLLISEGEKEEN